MARAVPYSPLASNELPSRSRMTPGVSPAWTLFLLPIYIDKLNCLLNKPQHAQLSGKSGTPAMRSNMVQKPQPFVLQGWKQKPRPHFIAANAAPPGSPNMLFTHHSAHLKVTTLSHAPKLEIFKAILRQAGLCLESVLLRHSRSPHLRNQMIGKRQPLLHTYIHRNAYKWDKYTWFYEIATM